VSASATSRARRSLARATLAAAFFFVATATQSQAAPTAILDEVHTIASQTVAAPVEHTFDVSVAGTYQLTLTDLGQSLTPSAPLAAVQLAITSGDTIVGTPLTAAGSVQFSATPGTYGIHVVGTPGTVAGSGIIGIQVTNTADQSSLASFSDTLAVPPQALPGTEAVIDDTFNVQSSGNFQVSLNDLQFPQSLSTLTLIVIAPGSATPVVILPDVNNGNAMQATVALTAGVDYRIFAVGQAAQTQVAGLYGTSVISSQDASVAYSKLVPIGAATALGSATLSAGTASLTLTDQAFPSALASANAVAVVNGQAAATLSAPGTQSFNATAGSYFVFALGTAAANSGGTYAVQLAPASGPAVISLARGVAAQGGSLEAFSFDTTVAAGTYKANLTDFQLPATFQSLRMIPVQAGATLGTALQAAGSSTVTAAAGPMSFVVFATPATGGGLFDVDLVPTSGTTPVFDQTQGSGALFSTRQLSITSAGSYAVIATDLAFPAAFANYDVVVTQGGQKIGSIFGNGSFPFNATAGNYSVNFIAQPGGSQMAGTYALQVVPAPLPTVSLTSSPTTVTTGDTVGLTWSSQNATACTASGGWTGSQALSGTATSAALTATTSFTLTCTGLGGSANATATVNVQAPSKSGGGGSIGALLDLILLAVLGLRLTERFVRSRFV